jgi:hypothetical protein
VTRTGPAWSALAHHGPDTNLCAGQELLLDVSRADASFQWQDGSSGSSYLVSKPGKYKVTVSNGSCAASGEVQADYEPALPVYTSEEKAYGCGSNALLLDATVEAGNVTYRWQDGTAGATFLAPGPGTFGEHVLHDFFRGFAGTEPLVGKAVESGLVKVRNGRRHYQPVRSVTKYGKTPKSSKKILFLL